MQPQAGVVVAQLKRMPQHQIEQGLGRLVIFEALLRIERIDRDPRGRNQPLDVVLLIVAAVGTNWVGFRERPVVDQRSGQSIVITEEKLLQHIGTFRAGVSETGQKFFALLEEAGDDRRAQEAAETLESEAVEELLRRVGHALRIFNRAGMKADHVQQQLMPIPTLSPKR